jgi:hypothetical protein
MARIRTVKPELWTNERVATCSPEAVLTFIGLLTQSDDHGRHRDNAAIIAGVLWPLRAEHTPVHVEDDLTQLAEAGLICRYNGCDGRRYLHIVGWQEHQKIDKPSQSRTPVCIGHHPGGQCGRCKGTCVSTIPGAGGEDSTNTPRALEPIPECRTSAPAAPAPVGTDTGGQVEGKLRQPPRASVEPAGQKAFRGDVVNPRGGFTEGSAPGSRILDPGSVIPTGREAPERSVGADTLVAEYISSCPQRPPGQVIGHLGRIVKQLLAEGIDPGHVRAGLVRYGDIQGHPSRLPSLVNDAMNTRPRAGIGGGHRAWTNPEDAASAYGEEL